MALDNLRGSSSRPSTGLGELVRVTHPVRARLEVGRDRRPLHEEPGRRARAAVRARAARRRHSGARTRSPSTCSARCAGCASRSASTTSTSIGGRISRDAQPEGARGTVRQAGHAAQAGRDRQVPAAGEGRTRRPARRSSCAATRSNLDADSVPHHLARRRRPLHHAADGHHHRSQPAASGTSGCTGSRCSAATRSPCTGSGTRSAPPTGARWRQQGERMPVVIALGGDPASIYSGSAPLPPTIDEFLFAGFLRREPVELARARHLRSRGAGRSGAGARGLHRSGRAAGARGTVRRPHRVLLAGRLLPAGARHGGHRPARPDLPGHAGRAARRWRTTTSGTPPSGSSCRCSSSRCPRSWTTTCRRRASSTTWCSSRSTSSIPGRPTR